MQGRFLLQPQRNYSRRRNPHRSAQKVNENYLGLKVEEMQIAANKNNSVSAFQPHVENFYHWCDKRKKFAVVEHRGFICESDNINEAVCDLLKMVRSQNEELSNQMLDNVKFKIGV